MGTHYFDIIWLPRRKRQYAVVLQMTTMWSRPRPQGQGHNPKAKATTPKAKAKADIFFDILWPQAKAKAKA